MKMMVAIVAVCTCVMFSCSKNSKPENVSGTINGKPAVTLYGSSNKEADYIFLSADTTVKQLSYNGIVLGYVNSTPPAIFLVQTSIAVAKGRLETNGQVKTLKIDTAYGFSFGSKEYTSR